MDIFLEFFLVFVLGWIIGSRLTSAWLHHSFRMILRELGIKDGDLRRLAEKNGVNLPATDTEDSSTELPELEVKIEQHQGTLYAFRKDTDQFLGQGTDRDQLIDSLKHNLTNVRVIIAKEDGADLIQKG